jgi:hypothetical protein
MSNNNGTPTSLRLKTGLAEMLKGGVIMDVTTAEQAVIAEQSGAVAVMALERVPSQIRRRKSARSWLPSLSPSWPNAASATSPKPKSSKSWAWITSMKAKC